MKFLNELTFQMLTFKEYMYTFICEQEVHKALYPLLQNM